MDSKKFKLPSIDYSIHDFENLTLELRSDERYVYQQFTGLKDKNGREIYEGDIFKFRRLNEKLHKIQEFPTFVEFQEGKYGHVLRGFNEYFVPLDYDNENVGIIGNIYENPELL